mmetsp:Transcript_74750/g.224732  ORF Transcript_74750/g.224732 Transcript_74750/m.224732 type:complete len:216 (-) Transcript_74750:815-1462(-)
MLPVRASTARLVIMHIRCRSRASGRSATMHAVRAAPSVGKGGNCAPPPHALSTTFSTREATNAPANATSGSRSALATADCCNWAARGAEDSAVINKHFEVLHERRALGLSTTLELYCGGTVTLGVGNARALGRPRALGSPRALGGTSLSFPVVACVSCSTKRSSCCSEVGAVTLLRAPHPSVVLRLRLLARKSRSFGHGATSSSDTCVSRGASQS